MRFLIAVSLFVAVAQGNKIHLKNRCPFTVWPGILGNPNKGQPAGGGFALKKNEVRVLDVPGHWAGRVWARTNCDGRGHCETGGCGNKIQCNGAGGVPPVYLAEITFNGAGGLDYYDISLVDGYNLPISMKPIGVKPGPGHYNCGKAGCVADLNAICPGKLAIKNRGGATVACKSACLAFNTDQYCCRGAHNTPKTCKSTHWPVNYPATFKRACPDAYSYAYDDTNSTFTCRHNSGRNYEIVFCP